MPHRLFMAKAKTGYRRVEFLFVERSGHFHAGVTAGGRSVDGLGTTGCSFAGQRCRRIGHNIMELSKGSPVE